MKKNHVKCKDCKKLIACDEHDSQKIIDSLRTTTPMSSKVGLCAICYHKFWKKQRKLESTQIKKNHPVSLK
jgi:hypothetical protein